MSEPKGNGEKCGANKNKTKGGGQCQLPAGWGTVHPGWGRCKFHAGNTHSGRVTAARQQMRAGAAFFGRPIETTPEEALLGEVKRSAGHVAYLEEQIQTAEFDGEDDREKTRQIAVLRTLYRNERKHLVMVCQTALHAGIQERAVQVAERWGADLANMIGAVLDEIGLDDDQRLRAPDILRRHLEPSERRPADILIDP